MEEKRIVLVPRGGLCNRMRAIASGVQLAKDENIPLDIYWRNMWDCACWWSDLFEPIGNEIYDGKHATVTLHDDNDWRYTAAHKRNLYWPYLMRWPWVKRELLNYNSAKSGDVRCHLAKSGVTFVSTGNVWHDMCDMNKLFNPIERIAMKIDDVSSAFNPHTVGLHIRRTDNVLSIKAASVDDYCATIDKEIAACGDVNFYLATDDAEVKGMLKRRYGERIICYEVPLCRNSLEGMQGAMVDLWCLSRTSRIIGSYYSSYSEIAALIGGIELCVLS